MESQKHKKEEIKGSYNFLYLKFNFSFLSTNKQYNLQNAKITPNMKVDILDRIIELSSDTIMALRTLGKERGYETINDSSIKITAKCNSNFHSNEERVQACGGKHYIFRLYPNNNPLPARIIGRLAKGVFYIFYIELEHKYV